MQTSNGFYGNTVPCRKGRRLARDSVQRHNDWINVNVKTRVRVVPEYHHAVGHHCHINLPKGRTDVLIIYNGDAPNRASRVLYTFHHPDKRPEGVSPIIHFDPAEITAEARKRIYFKVNRVLKSRPKSALRKVPSRERPYSLLSAEPYVWGKTLD